MRYEIQVKPDAGDATRWSVYVYADVHSWTGRESRHDLPTEQAAFRTGLAFVQDLHAQAKTLGMLASESTR